MNIIERHKQYYDEKLKRDFLEGVMLVNKRIAEDTKKWKEKFTNELETPSKEVVAINNELKINTTKEQRNKIICKIIKESADKNYEYIKKVQKENPNSPVVVIKTDIDECIIMNKEDGFTIFEGDTETTIQKLKVYLTKGINDLGTTTTYIDMEDKISQEEQEKLLVELEIKLKNSQYNWAKVEAVTEINKWIVIDKKDNKVRFIAPPEKIYKILK